MSHCPHCYKPLEAPASSPQVLADVKAIRSRSTETEAQEQRILAALRTGPKTTDDLRRLGIYQVSARIWSLRQQGNEIETALFDGYSADGYSHARMARYTLKAEPLPLGAGTAREAPQNRAGTHDGGEVACG